MPRPSIKICGIQTPTIASLAALAGADYIGIIFHPTSKRYVTPELAKDIATAARENGTTPVGVFVNHTAEEMDEICKTANLEVIQLHGEIAKKEHHLLLANYQRFYVLSVSLNGELQEDKEGGLRYCDTARDSVLVDNAQAGSGKPFDWNKFHYDQPFKMGLAGGLNPDNVAEAIKTLNPEMVDVSSGVENQSGQKDILLIRQFIKSVHNCD